MLSDKEMIEKVAILYGEDRWKDSFYGEYITEQDREYCRTWARIALPVVKATTQEILGEMLESAEEHYIVEVGCDCYCIPTEDVKQIKEKYTGDSQ